jgi:hypothetical protein
MKRRKTQRGLKVFALLCCSTLIGVSSTRCAADEARVLPDLTAPGQWRLYQWNKAEGRLAIRPEFPAKVKEGSVGQRQSLGIKIDWPGGEDFRFFTVEPVATLQPIPFQATELRAWINGSGTNHSIEAHFTDADGQGVKTGLGDTGARGWRHVITKIPTTWKQPLTLKTLTFHNWSERKAIPITVYMTRLEVVGENGKTTALPLAPAEPKAVNQTTAAPTGIARIVSDMNLPGEWRVAPSTLVGGALAISEQFPSEVTTDVDAARRALKVNIKFPGSAAGYTLQTFQIEPLQNLPVPFQLLEVRLWLRGTGTSHNVELHFSDGDGKRVNIGTTPGKLDFSDWKQVTVKIPADWQQPLTFHGIGFTAWGIKEAADLNTEMTRLEFVIDSNQPLKGDESDTNDQW